MLQPWSYRSILIWILVQGIFGLLMRNRVLKILEAVETPAHDLKLLSQILERMEREQFTSPRLIELRKELETEGHPPSREIARLQRMLDWQEQSHNQFFAPIARLLLWSTQFSLAIEEWRRRSGPFIAKWLEAVR